MAIWLGLLLGVVAVGEFNLNRLMETVAQITDDVSADITDESFEQDVLRAPWIIYLYHPADFKSRIFGPQWKFLAEKDTGELNVGKINVAENMKTARRLGVSAVPSFVFIDAEQYVYNYTGRAEGQAVLELLETRSYLQFDRKHLPPDNDSLRLVSYYCRFLVQEHPLYTAAGGLLITHLIVVAFSRVFNRKKSRQKEE